MEKNSNKKHDSIGSRLADLIGGTMFLPCILYGSWVIKGTDSIYGFLGWFAIIVSPVLTGMLVYDWYKFLSAKAPLESKGI